MNEWMETEGSEWDSVERCFIFAWLCCCLDPPPSLWDYEYVYLSKTQKQKKKIEKEKEKKMAAAFCSSCCVVIPCSWSSRGLLHSSAHPFPLNCRNGKRGTRRSKSKSHFSNTPTTPPPSPRKLLTKCLPQSQKQSQLQPSESETETEFEFERLFSNLNQATLKREAGLVTHLLL